MKKLVSVLIVMTMILTSLTVPVSVSAADAAQTSTSNILLTEDFEGEGNVFDANVTNVDAFGGKSGKVGQIDLGVCQAALDIADIYGGGVKVSYDAYVISGGNRPIMGKPAAGSESTKEYHLAQIFQNKIRRTDSKETADLIYTAEAENWYHLEQVINLEVGVVQTEVYAADKKTLLAKGAYGAGCDSIGEIIFKNWSEGSNFFIDDVQVEIYDVTPKPGVIAFENFEGTSNVFGESCTNETFEGKNAGKVSQTSVTVDFNDVYSGSVKLSFEYYAKGATGSNVNTNVILNPAGGDASGVDTAVLQMFQHRVRYVTGEQANICGGDNGWRYVEQVFDTGSGIVKTYVYSIDKQTLLGEGSEAIAYASIGAITFKSVSANMDFYMDNVSVEILNTKVQPGVICTENFEKTDGTNAFDANCTNTVLSRDTETWNAGAVSKGNKRATLEFDDISNGGVKLAYDVYVVSGGERFIYVNSDSTENEVLYIFQYRIYDKKASKGTGNSGYMCLDAANSWLSVEQYIDLDKQTMKTMVYDEDDKLLAVEGSDITFESVDSLVFHNYSGTSSSDFYVDNISVETYDNTQEAEILSTEDFEGDSIKLDSNCVKESDGGLNYGSITKAVSVLDFEDVYYGTVKVSYDAYAFGGDTNVNCTVSAIPASVGATDLKTDLVQIFQHRIRYMIDVVENDSRNIHAKDNGWYHIEQILDLEKGTVNTQVYSLNRDFLAEKTEAVGCYSIGKLRFNSTGSHPFYVDNIQVEKYVDRPEVTAIAAYDIYGNMVENLASATHAIGSIEVTFDETIARTNPSTYFVLQDSDGTELNIGGKINDNVYTMLLTDKLLPGNTYSIVVSENVMDTDGNTAGANYTTSLTTIAASEISNAVKIISAERDNGKIKVNAGFINATTETMPMVFIVAFYDENGNMLAIDTPEVKDSAAAYGLMNMTFDDYAGEGTVDETKLFFWDSLKGLIPYGTVVIF